LISKPAFRDVSKSFRYFRIGAEEIAHGLRHEVIQHTGTVRWKVDIRALPVRAQISATSGGIRASGACGAEAAAGTIRNLERQEIASNTRD
jgi:hypothetical protein